MPRLIGLLLVALISAGCLTAQTNSSGRDSEFQISAGQPWLDTGLDLAAGDSIDISASAAPAADSGTPACDPKGIEAVGAAGLPAPSLPPGALLARLRPEGSTPVLVGLSMYTHIVAPSHLFLRLNAGDAALCQGSVTVKVHATGAAVVANTALAATTTAPATTAPATTATTANTATPASGQQKTRGEELKSQLSTAAQIFMQGQFGVGKSEANAGGTSSAVGGSSANSSEATSPAAPALQVSTTSLDHDLRGKIDHLPRRVNDQLQNLGDMVNFVIIGNQKDVQDALSAASWHVADSDTTNAVVNAIRQTIDSKDYLAMPMSTLFLFGRKQDFGYEMAEPIAMVASRHHFRIWKTDFTYKGKEVWCGAGTHDIGFAKDKRNNSVTHKIDPAVDGERDNIGASLQKTGKTQSLTYYLPPDPVQDAKNATGDGYHSDGRLLVILLK